MARQGVCIQSRICYNPLLLNRGRAPGVNHSRAARFIEEGGLSVMTYSSVLNRPRESSIFKLMAVFMLLALCTVIMVPSAWSQDSTASSSGTATEGGT